MATKIRCSECRKKISVDEAFAGSMCRCPYCKAIVMVPKPGDSTAKGLGSRPSRPTTGRPSAPTARRGVSDGTGLRNVVGSRPIVKDFETRPQRPGTPKIPAEKSAPDSARPSPPQKSREELLEIPLSPAIPQQKAAGEMVVDTVSVDASRFSAEQLAAIPTANPILFQGVVSLVLIVIMLLMTAACVYLGVRIFSKPVESSPTYIPTNGTFEQTDLENPFTAGGSSSVVCGNIPVDTPVVYCIDAGANMGEDMYPLARAAAFASIISLGDSRKFGIVMLQEDSTKLVGGEMLSGGWAGFRAIKGEMLPADGTGGTIKIGGTTDLMLGVSKALSCKPKPKTIVMIISCRYIDNPRDIASTIKKAGAKLVLVMLGIDNAEQINAAEVLVKEAGGNSQSVIYETKEELADMFGNSNIPE